MSLFIVLIYPLTSLLVLSFYVSLYTFVHLIRETWMFVEVLQLHLKVDPT